MRRTQAYQNKTKGTSENLNRAMQDYQRHLKSSKKRTKPKRPGV